MLIGSKTLAGIVDGRVTLAFRRWKRPTVRAGGTLLTAAGQLAIEAVDRVGVEDITGEDARRAGFGDRDALVDALGPSERGVVYRVRLRFAGPDPRIALRESVPSARELGEITARLDRLDRASPGGPWTRRTLELIRERPAVRAAELARTLGMEKTRFKGNVRKLKGIGLTESLEVGYRLSPRGEAVLAASA